jgi:hypothetical protein
MASYHHVQAQHPQTLAYALSDSPVGLLAWNSQCMADLDPEMLLAHVSIRGLTGTAGSAVRIYAELIRRNRRRIFPFRPQRPDGTCGTGGTIRLARTPPGRRSLRIHPSP